MPLKAKMLLISNSRDPPNASIHTHTHTCTHSQVYLDTFLLSVMQKGHLVEYKLLKVSFQDLE